MLQALAHIVQVPEIIKHYPYNDNIIFIMIIYPKLIELLNRKILYLIHPSTIC